MPRHTYDGLTRVIGSKLYVLVGFCSDCTHRIDRRLYRYDPATNTWNTSLAWAPHSHAFGAGGVIKGKFYVAGAVIQNQLYVIGDGRLVVAYDPPTNTWKEKNALPTGRIYLAAASFVTPSGNPKILAVGGQGSAASTANESYTP